MGLVSYLAEELLLAAGEDDTILQRLQHDRLAPLELTLLACPAPLTDPATLANVVRDQLHDPVTSR